MFIFFNFNSPPFISLLHVFYKIHNHFTLQVSAQPQLFFQIYIALYILYILLHLYVCIKCNKVTDIHIYIYIYTNNNNNNRHQNILKYINTPSIMFVKHVIILDARFFSSFQLQLGRLSARARLFSCTLCVFVSRKNNNE